MKVRVDLPVIEECAVDACAYNRDRHCHAQAITVGNSSMALCDTFLPSSRHNRRQDNGGVGACKAVDCQHNDDFACQAEAIRVGSHPKGAECETFRPRP
jgi:hypothetical protein